MGERKPHQKNVDYPIFVRGPLPDLGDVLQIARQQGKRVLKGKPVRVKPICTPMGDDYLVVVEPKGSGRSASSAVEEGTRKQK